MRRCVRVVRTELTRATNEDNREMTPVQRETAAAGLSWTACSLASVTGVACSGVGAAAPLVWFWSGGGCSSGLGVGCGVVRVPGVVVAVLVGDLVGVPVADVLIVGGTGSGSAGSPAREKWTSAVQGDPARMNPQWT